MSKKRGTSSQEIASDSADNFIAKFMKKKTLGVPNWGWGIVIASVGLFHASK